jgi:glyoxylase-like metal-dependent hydrolase (beta-lactamase superfamily II)
MRSALIAFKEGARRDSRVTDSEIDVGGLAEARALGIFPLVLRTPFGIGPVNTYLIEDDPLTLVDCGPNMATELSRLEELLGTRGHQLSDVGLIVLTHQHIDHTGLASTLARRSGADVACMDLLAPVMSNWTEHSIAADEDAFALMLRHGVESHVAEALRAVAGITREFGAPVAVDHGLTDGGTLALRDRTFRVQFRPGHSPSDIVLHDESNRIAIVGDHLLSRVSSNALVDRPLNGTLTTRPEPLLTYRRSLLATRALDFDIGLGGHCDPVLDHQSLIDERLLGQDCRAAHLYGLLADGPQSAHELATACWGQVAVTQAFLTLSEVLGHLGLLTAEGRVQEDRSGDVVRFSRSE